jgi:asparagine synthase (glutamine-hydrolysing)
MPPRARSIDESDDQLAAELEELLRTSVRSRLIADVPVGVFLSGGIDSTLVTALAAQEHSGRLRSFTVSYDVGTVNEDEPARAAARILGTEHAEVVLEQTGLDHKVEELLGSIDQPNADPALLPLATVAALARQNVTVAVGGEGADELFGGYPRYRWLQRAATLDHVIPSGIRTLAARAVRDRVSSARVRRIADVLEPTDVAVRHLDWVTDQRRRAREGLYGPRLRAAAGEGALADVRRIVGNHSDGETAERFIALDLQRWLPDDVLCKADRATMFNSLEMRTPFLERNVAEFTASIPAAELLAHGGKSLLDAVLARIPGAPKVKRAKTAFRVPHSEWLRGPLRELVSDCVTGGRLVDEGWFDRAAIERIAREHTFGADHSVVLWPALALGLWLEGAGQEFAAA